MIARFVDTWFGHSRALLLIMLFGVLAMGMVPRISVQRVARGDDELSERSLPLSVDAKNETLDVELLIERRAIQARWMRMLGDDCVSSLWINDKDVPLPTCEEQSGGKGLTLDLSPHTVPGKNLARLIVSDTHGGAQGVELMFPLDRGVLFFMRAAIIMLISAYILLWAARRTGGDRWIIGIVALGLLLRILYNADTPYDIRGHDAWGHLDYVRYMFDHWSVPPGGGYEYHQAPLYYALAAIVLSYAIQLGWPEPQALLLVHQLSLVASMFTVMALAWTGSVVFEKEKAGLWVFRVFLLLAVAVPRNVMLSSPVSNDALLLLAMTLSLGMIARFWKTGREAHWYAAVVAFAFAFLVKLNAVVLLPAYGVAVLLRRNAGWQRNLRTALGGGLLLLLLAGWLPFIRMTQSEGDIKNVVNFGKGGGNNVQLLIGRDPIRFAVFNPLGVLQHPFNDPWSDGDRRLYYWEYLLRGSAFGEFRFDSSRAVAPYLLATIMGLCAFAFVGFDRSLRAAWRKTMPTWLTLLAVLAAAVAYAYVHPYSSEQDFRFSPLLGVLVPFFAALGIAYAKGWWRWLGLALAGTFAALSLVFFLIL